MSDPVAEYQDATEGYTDAEKDIYNLAYVQASADALNALNELMALDSNDHEKVENISYFIAAASVPIMLVEAHLGKKLLV
jgi:hypothetical protein